MTEIGMTEIDKSLIDRYSTPLRKAAAVFIIHKKTETKDNDTSVITSQAFGRIIVYDDDSIGFLQGDICSTHTLHHFPKESNND